MKYLLLAFLLASLNIQAQVVSLVVKTNSHKIDINLNSVGSEEVGSIQLAPCRECPKQNYTLTNKTDLVVNGVIKNITELKQASKDFPSTIVRVQVNTRHHFVYYIEWGPLGDEPEHAQ